MGNADSMRKAAAIIVAALLEKIENLLDIETRNSSPKLGGQWPRIRSLLNLESPALDRGYYVWGLLDCAAQLSTLTDASVQRESFFSKLRHIVVTTNVEEYRWKAMEVLLAFQPTRTEQYRALQSVIATRLSYMAKEKALEETVMIQDLLEQDEEAHLRLCLPPLPEGKF